MNVINLGWWGHDDARTLRTVKPQVVMMTRHHLQRWMICRVDFWLDCIFNVRYGERISVRRGEDWRWKGCGGGWDREVRGWEGGGSRISGIKWRRGWRGRLNPLIVGILESGSLHMMAVRRMRGLKLNLLSEDWFQGNDVFNRFLECFDFGHSLAPVLDGNMLAEDGERRVDRLDASPLPSVPSGDEMSWLLSMRDVFICRLAWFPSVIKS